MTIFKKIAMSMTLATAFFAASAQANLITTDVSISTTNSVKYVYFDVTTAGGFDIRALGDSSLNPSSTWNNDPEIHLFQTSLISSNLLYSDDDSGTGTDALIDNVLLAIGRYILAISEFNFTSAEAINGINTSGNGVDDPGFIRIQIEGVGYTTGSRQNPIIVSAGNAAFAVPEPASLALMGLGLAGLGMIRRRKS